MNTELIIAEHGLSIVVAPPQATSDIVFVHGLQGHPEKTWTYRATSETSKKCRLFRHRKNQIESRNGIFWPLELLSQDHRLSKARILTFGYDSVVAKVFGAQNQQNISRYGNDLMVALQQERREHPNRPLVFVAHSLGGILVKVALAKSKDSRQAVDLPIFDSTRGIVFLGTPHRGSESANWGLMATNLAKLALQGSNQKVLQGLTPNNQYLEDFSERFLQLLDEGTFSIYSFYETQATSAYGIEREVVPYHSAIVGDVKRERKMSINANHRGICKFGSASDSGYKAIIAAIIDCLAPSIEKETQKQEVGYTHTSVKQSTLQDDATSFATDIKNMKSPHGTGLVGRNSLVAISNSEAWHSNMSLAATTIDTYSNYLSTIGLSKAELETYGLRSPLVEEEHLSAKSEWFFDNPDFSDWVSDDSTKILQLGGQIKQNVLVFRQLLKRLDEQELKVVYFSSSVSENERSGRPKPLEHSHRILRTLISQLVESDMELLVDLIRREKMEEMVTTQPLSRSNPSFTILTELFHHVLAGQQDDRLFILLDGLDVLGHEMKRFIYELRSLQDKLKKAERTDTHRPIIKIFISTPPQTVSGLLDQNSKIDSIVYIEKDKERQDCLQSLHTSDFMVRPGIIEDPDPGAYDWLNEDEKYNKWKSSDLSSLLLIEGKPGSGKSTLAKTIVNIMENAKHHDKSLVAYFFYSYRGGGKETSHIVMMQSILHQLLDQEQDFFPFFREHHRERRRSSAIHWTLKELLEILRKLSSVKRDLRTYIILDAMDESDNEDLSVVLRTMASVCSPESPGSFKIVMTTRPLPKSTVNFDVKGLTEFSLIMDEKNRPAIDMVVDRRIEHLIEAAMRAEDGVDSTLFDEIREHIKSHAEGVFLWVDLVLREFKTLWDEGFSKSQLEELKRRLPLKLTDVYRRIIDRLTKNQPNDIAQGRKILALTAFSLVRLQVDEIKDAIIIPSYLEAEHFIPELCIADDRVHGLERRIQKDCGDLLDIKNHFVQLTHESVRDFLLDANQSAGPFHIPKERGRNEVTSIFSRYLEWSLSARVLMAVGITIIHIAEWKNHDYEAFIKLLEDRPLLNYVLSSLPEHIKNTNHEGIKAEFDRILKGLEQFEPARYLLLDSIHASSFNPTTEDEIAHARTFRSKLMCLAAQLGHRRVIRQLATIGTPLEPLDDVTESSALYAAIAGGQHRAVELLLDLGASTDTQDTLGETALHKAVLHRELEIVRTLLDRGAIVDVPNLIHESPLHLAAGRGYEDIVELLLENEADVDLADQFDATSLHKAVENGHSLVAELLLKHEADVDSDAKYTGTPLHIAVDKRSIYMAKLLLQCNALVDEAREYGATPLHSAASEGHAEMILLLKEHGADVDTKDRYGLKAWDWANNHGQHHVLDLLHVSDNDDKENS